MIRHQFPRLPYLFIAYSSPKFYDKSDQVSINKKDSADYKTRHVLRLEIKTYGMKFLHRLASKTSQKRITNISDLAHPEGLGAFKNKLVEEYDKLLIVDHEQLDI